MTAADLLNMFGGLRLLEYIRYRHPDVHKQMAGSSLDNLFTIRGVASEASRLVHLWKDSPESQTCFSRPGGSAQKRNDKSAGTSPKQGGRCNYRGKCFKIRDGKECPNRHTEEDFKKAKELGPSPGTKRKQAKAEAKPENTGQALVAVTADRVANPENERRNLIPMSTNHFRE